MNTRNHAKNPILRNRMIELVMDLRKKYKSNSEVYRATGISRPTLQKYERMAVLESLRKADQPTTVEIAPLSLTTVIRRHRRSVLLEVASMKYHLPYLQALVESFKARQHMARPSRTGPLWNNG